MGLVDIPRALTLFGRNIQNVSSENNLKEIRYDKEKNVLGRADSFSSADSVLLYRLHQSQIPLFPPTFSRYSITAAHWEAATTAQPRLD
jgi:hypothetical protein